MNHKRYTSPGLSVVVVGCGRLGSHIAEILSGEGQSVVIVDKRPRAFAALSGDFSGFTLEGDATECDVLRRAELGKADVLIATTESDNVNIFVSLAGKNVFGAKRTLARVYDRDLQRLCSLLGIRTVCPSTVVGEIFLDSVSAARKEA